MWNQSWHLLMKVMLKVLLQRKSQLVLIKSYICSWIRQAGHFTRRYVHCMGTTKNDMTQITFPVMINWATRGVYLGSRRVLLNTEVCPFTHSCIVSDVQLQTDDIFLDTQTWNPTIVGDGTVAFRMSPEDMQFTSDFADYLNTVCFILLCHYLIIEEDSSKRQQFPCRVAIQWRRCDRLWRIHKRCIVLESSWTSTQVLLDEVCM